MMPSVCWNPGFLCVKRCLVLTRVLGFWQEFRGDQAAVLNYLIPLLCNARSCLPSANLYLAAMILLVCVYLEMVGANGSLDIYRGYIYGKRS